MQWPRMHISRTTPIQDAAGQSTTYAVPNQPAPLPAFSLRELPVAQASVTPIGWLTALPLATDVDRLSQQLLQVSQELEKSQCLVSEAQLEKELLVAERTQIIMQLQALTAALSTAPAMLTAFDEAAAATAEQRVKQLRSTLPPTSSVRLLSEQSELQPHIQGLHRHLTQLRDAWLQEAAELHQAAAVAQGEAGSCRADSERAKHEQQGAESKEQSYQKQIQDLEGRVCQQREDFENRLKMMKDQVYSSQQDAAASQHELAKLATQLKRQEEQHRRALEQQQEQHKRSLEEQQEQGKRNLEGKEQQHRRSLEEKEQQHRRSLEEQQQQHRSSFQQQADEATELVRRSTAKVADVERSCREQARQQHQEQVTMLQEQLRQALHARQELEESKRMAAVRALQSEKLLHERALKLKQDNKRLQAVLVEAEKQLVAVRDDVMGVKRRQVELQGRLLDQKQSRGKIRQTLVQSADRGIRDVSPHTVQRLPTAGTRDESEIDLPTSLDKSMLQLLTRLREV